MGSNLQNTVKCRTSGMFFDGVLEHVLDRCEFMLGFYQNKITFYAIFLGGISIRHEDDIYIAPSGVQKERILPSELFCTDMAGSKFIKPKNDVSSLSGRIFRGI